MKKLFILALASLFAFASCSKESNETPEVNDNNTVNLTFTSKRPQLKSESKTAWDGSTIVWSKGDKIRVGGTFNGSWMTSSGSATASFYQSNEVSIDTDNKSVGTFTVPNNFHDDKGAGTYIFYGYSPQSANSSSDQNNAPYVDLTVPTSQTPLANSFDAGADVMLGKTESLSLAGLPTDPIEINWSRLVAHLDLTFKNLAFDGAETISSITLTANEDSKLTGTFTVDVTNGTMSAASSNVVVMEGAHLVANSGNVEAWCCVLPVTVTSLNVEVVTDKAKYTRSIPGISKTFKQNARNTLAINMSSATRTKQSEVYELYSGTISEGDYVIVYDGAAMKNTVSSDRLQYSDVTISDNKIANPASDIIWHIAPSGDYWTIYSAVISKYAAATNSKNQAALSDNGTDDKSLWTVSVSGTSAYEFENKARAASSTNPDNKFLRKNGANGFACYSSSTGGALSLYKLADGRADAELSFTENSFNVNVGDDFTAPTLTNPHNVAVTYSSSNENLAVVDENTGEVLIGENAGTVIITASFAGNTTYKPGTASYTINITDPNGNDGSAEKPYTASEAIAKAKTLGTGTIADVYVKGIVCTTGSVNTKYNSVTYYISNDGSTTNRFEVYSGKYVDGADFTDENNVKLGDFVIVKGTLKYYSNGNQAEFDYNNEIVSILRAPVFTPDGGNFTVESQSVTISADAGATIYYTTDGSTPTTSSAVYSTAISISETTIIKAFAVKDGTTTGIVEKTFTKTVPSSSTTATITFGNSGVKIDAASVTGSDSGENTWSITTEGTTSFTQSSGYSQVGSSSKPATSITFTTTLPSSKKVTNMSAKFGGFSGTAGTVTLKVGDSSIGSGSLSGSSDVTVTSTTTANGTVLTVTVTGISKGVKVYNISVTYE